MARYIDANKVMEEIRRIGGHNLCEWETIGVKALIDRQTTADVAPRSEVAKEIFEEIEKIACVYKLDGDFYLDNGLYAELKKKHIGE